MCQKCEGKLRNVGREIRMLFFYGYLDYPSRVIHTPRSSFDVHNVCAWVIIDSTLVIFGEKEEIREGACLP
jgi:hypothetical protein